MTADFVIGAYHRLFEIENHSGCPSTDGGQHPVAVVVPGPGHHGRPGQAHRERRVAQPGPALRLLPLRPVDDQLPGLVQHQDVLDPGRLGRELGQLAARGPEPSSRVSMSARANFQRRTDDGIPTPG